MVSIFAYSQSSWRQRRRQGIAVPLIAIVEVIAIVTAAPIVIVTIRATICVLIFSVAGNGRTRAPGLRVRCWRWRVVRIRRIYARTVVPRVTELELVGPMLASAIRIISPPRFVASTVVRRI
jgi:hypothetical protein